MENTQRLSGAASDTLFKLNFFGAQDDGDLPSKRGMTELIERGYAKKDYDLVKPNIITKTGVSALEYEMSFPI